MFSRKIRSIIIVTLILCGLALRTEATTSVHATGLSQPTKITQSSLGNLLVTETLEGPNNGRISIIQWDGLRRTLIAGLPSGLSPEGWSGPTGIDMPCRAQYVNGTSGAQGRLYCGTRVLYVAIGEGDSHLPGPFPGTVVPNPNPSSPLFSSVLKIIFSERVERSTTGFTLTLAHQLILASGGLVVLDNGGGDWIAIQRLVDFPNSTSNGNVHASNPFALAANNTHVYVADAGMNHVAKVNILSGQWQVLASFPPRPNPQPFGPPVIEAVPTAVRVQDNQLLVALFTGFPFVPGLSEVVQVDSTTGRYRSLIRDRSSVTDVLFDQTRRVIRGESRESITGDRYYVLEHSTDLLAGERGRLLGYQTSYWYFPGQLLPPPLVSGPWVLANGLNEPTGMVLDAWSGDMFITEIFAGRIVRVELN